jgi:hypothetical protein
MVKRTAGFLPDETAGFLPDETAGFLPDELSGLPSGDRMVGQEGK